MSLRRYTSIHDRRRVYENLFLFVTAQASAGKGRLELCKNIVMHIHEKRRAEYASLKEKYDADMTTFLKSSKKEGLSRPKEPPMKTLIMPANSSACTALRLMEGMPMKPILFCSDTDYQTALTMVQVLLKHTTKVFETLPTSAAINTLTDKTGAKQNFFNQLPPDFSRETFITLAAKLKIPQRTAERYIKSFCGEGKLVRTFHGQYRKP